MNRELFIQVSVIVVFFLSFIFIKKNTRWNLLKSEIDNEWNDIYYLPAILQVSAKSLFFGIFTLVLIFQLVIICYDSVITNKELSILSSVILIFVILYNIYVRNNKKLYCIWSKNKRKRIIFHKEYFEYIDYINQIKYKMYYNEIYKLRLIKHFYSPISRRGPRHFYNISRVFVKNENREVEKLSIFNLWLKNKRNFFNFYGWEELQNKFKSLISKKTIIENIKYEELWKPNSVIEN